MDDLREKIVKLIQEYKVTRKGYGKYMDDIARAAACQIENAIDDLETIVYGKPSYQYGLDELE